MMLNVMEAQMRVETNGYCSSTQQTMNLLLKAVAEGSSLEAVCADTMDRVASNMLREHLNAALSVEALRAKEGEMNQALQAALPRGIPRGGLVDTHVRDPKLMRKQRKCLVFFPVEVDWTLHQVFAKYRRRFGIEASYRLLRQVKVLTNSHNPALRFFIFGFGTGYAERLGAGMLALTRRPGKGRHKLIPSLLRFATFRKLLVRAVERFYPPPLAVAVFVSPKSVIH